MARDLNTLLKSKVMETALNREKLNDLKRRLLQSNSKMKNGFDRALINLGVHQINQDKK